MPLFWHAISSAIEPLLFCMRLHREEYLYIYTKYQKDILEVKEKGNILLLIYRQQEV